MDRNKPQFRVVEGVDGGAMIYVNYEMRQVLIRLLAEVGELDPAEKAFLHNLKYPVIVNTRPGRVDIRGLDADHREGA